MTKFALLIGVSECTGGFKPLPSAVINVDALHGVFVDPQQGEFLTENIQVLKNPNKQEMEKAIYWLFNKRKKDDLLLFYFSGYGIVNYHIRPELYLTTGITRKQENGYLDRRSALATAYLRQRIESSNSQQQVIILDCCYSAAIAYSTRIIDDDTVKVDDYLGGKGRTIITSTTTREVSIAGNIKADGSNGLSIYTHYLVEGLTTGAADLDKDGTISVDELYEYAAQKVKIAAPAMTPKLYPLSDGSKIVVAKSPTDDPKLEYENYLIQLCHRFDRRSYFSSIQLKTLATKQQKLGISPEDVNTIEERVLQPYREYLKKLIEYEHELTLAVREGYSLVYLLADLKEYQQELQLRDEDIAEIHWRILPPIEPTQTTIFLSTFSFETVRVKVKKINSGLFSGTKLAIVKTPAQAQHFVEELGNGVKLDMVYVPGGQFMMGTDDRQFEEYLNHVKKDLSLTEAQIDDYRKIYPGRPQHSVNVPALLMSKYPVTQAQYKIIIGSNPSRFKGSQRPVEMVSWDDAQAFCQKLANQTNKSYRLPSEAEWEYACRAGSNTPFYCGETISLDVVNYDCRFPYGQATKGFSPISTTNVGIFPPNSFGLYDLHGNVWEWCQDNWHKNYQGAPTDGSPWLNETNYRVLRGGSWLYYSGDCRSDARRSGSSEHRAVVFGFRLVLPLQPRLSLVFSHS